MQHYVYSPFFHNTYDDFLSQLNRDEIKRITCFVEDVDLFEVSNEDDLETTIKQIYGLIDKPSLPSDDMNIDRIRKKKKIKKMIDEIGFCVKKINNIRKMIEQNPNNPEKDFLLQKIKNKEQYITGNIAEIKRQWRITNRRLQWHNGKTLHHSLEATQSISLTFGKQR